MPLGAGLGAASRAGLWLGGDIQKRGQKKENQQNRLMNPNEVCWKPGLFRGGGGSWIPDFNLHGKPQQCSDAPLGAGSWRCRRPWARSRSPLWSRIRGGRGAGGGLQRWAGDLVPDALIAHEGSCPLVAIAMLALHVADAVGRVAVVGADIAGAGHGATCAAPAGRGESQRHPSVLGSAQWHPSAPISAHQCSAVPGNTSGTHWHPTGVHHCHTVPGGTHQHLSVPIGALWHPSVPDGTHQRSLGSIGTWWFPVVPISTHRCPSVPIIVWWYP